MPGFTFEKIAPPDERKPATPTENDKPRGAVVQMLERFAEVRMWRKLRKENDATAIRPERSED